jgi:predicted phage tail protein
VTPTAPLNPPAQPAAPTATAGIVSATVTWIAPASNGAPVNGGPAIATYEVVANPAAAGGDVTGIPAGTTTATVPGLTAGTSYTFRVRAVNSDGQGPLSAASNAVTPTALGAPVRPVNAVAVRGNTQVTLSWVDGAVPVSSHLVQIRIAGVVQETRTVGAASSAIITGLANGTAYTFRVAAVNATATSVFSPASNAATPATVPGAPVIGTAVQGAAGGNLTATANWTAPATTGGANRRGYRVTATPTGAGAPVTVTVGANAITRSMVLPAGTYTFTVVAFNAVGDGPASLASNPVTAR